MKIVINTDFGAFSLSHKAVMRYAELKNIHMTPKFTEIQQSINSGKKIPSFEDHNVCVDYFLDDGEYFRNYDILRNDPCLIQVVEEMKQKASNMGFLEIVEIPDNVEFEVMEGEGGIEWVAEKHRRWFGKGPWERDFDSKEVN